MFLLRNPILFAVIMLAVMILKDWLRSKEKVRRELLFPIPGKASFTFYFLPLRGYPSFITYTDTAGRRISCAINAGLEYEIEEPGKARRITLLTGYWWQDSDWVYLSDLTFKELKRLSYSVSRLPFEHDNLLASLCYQVSGVFADCEKSLSRK